jgi:hypothetical protein
MAKVLRRYLLPDVQRDLARKMVFLAGPRQVGKTTLARPFLLVECKWADAPVDRGLRYLKQRSSGCDAWQISATGRKDYVSPDGIRVAPAVTFLRTLV